MKVVVTEPALADLEDIYVYLTQRYSAVRSSVKSQILSTFVRLKRFPESAPLVGHRKSVRCVVLTKYPYKIFYKIDNRFINILHIYHAARDI